MTETVARFDDSLLPLAEPAMVRQRTDEIKELMRRTAQDLIAVGVRLIEVKAL